MFEVERVLQSHEEFVLGDDIHLNLIHVNMPSGSGNKNRKTLWCEFANPNATETVLCVHQKR